MCSSGEVEGTEEEGRPPTKTWSSDDMVGLPLDPLDPLETDAATAPSGGTKPAYYWREGTLKIPLSINNRDIFERERDGGGVRVVRVTLVECTSRRRVALGAAATAYRVSKRNPSSERDACGGGNTLAFPQLVGWFGGRSLYALSGTAAAVQDRRVSNDSSRTSVGF